MLQVKFTTKIIKRLFKTDYYKILVVIPLAFGLYKPDGSLRRISCSNLEIVKYIAIFGHIIPSTF